MVAMNSIFTLNVSHLQLYRGIIWYPLWLRLYYFIPDISNLLQAKERNSRRWEQCAYNKYRNSLDVSSASNSELYRAKISLSDADSHFFPNNSSYCFLNVCITNREQITRNVTILRKKQLYERKTSLTLIWNIICEGVSIFGICKKQKTTSKRQSDCCL
jgi:hypothetical protein